MRLFGAGWGLRAGLGLAVGAALCAVQPGLAQREIPNAPDPSQSAKPYTLPDRLPDKPSQPPAFKIPVEPLGFSAPGPLYLGQRNSVVSLDFLDENRLLFTFRVPGLIHREAGESDERRIRAVVLGLPAGTVEAEALWTVHDRARYLWMLSDGRFLLRDRNNLETGRRHAGAEALPAFSRTAALAGAGPHTTVSGDRLARARDSLAEESQ